MDADLHQGDTAGWGEGGVKTPMLMGFSGFCVSLFVILKFVQNPSFRFENCHGRSRKLCR